MKFIESPLAGVYVIDLEPMIDDRGYFARTFCADEFERAGLVTDWVQCNTSFNRYAGTIRGLHYQCGPYSETKLVRCTRGTAFDVAVDIRQESPTYGRWFSVELSADNHRMVYIAEGFAHGFQTLVDNTELSYQMSAFYRPEFARGIRWDDPEIAVAWPREKSTMSARDHELPLLADISGLGRKEPTL